MALSLDAIVTKTRQGMITGWSPVAVDLYGYQPEEIIGRDSAVLLPAGWESEEADLLRRAAAGERIAPYSTNRVRKDGTIIAVLLGMSAIVDEAGAIVGVASTSRLLPAGASAPLICTCRTRTGNGCGRNWNRPSGWRASGSSPAGSPTTSTTCSR